MFWSRIFTRRRPSVSVEPTEVGDIPKLRILLVCMGNICRSPLAEAIAREVAEERGLGGLVEFDSAGTHGYHVGEPPDERARQVGAKRGYRLDHLRARKVTEEDFSRFDLVLAADRQNLEFLQRICPEEYSGKVRLLMSLAPESDVPEVPDPYYGSVEGFERVADLCEAATEGILAYVTRATAVR